MNSWAAIIAVPTAITGYDSRSPQSKRGARGIGELPFLALWPGWCRPQVSPMESRVERSFDRARYSLLR